MRSDWDLPICNGAERLKEKWKKSPLNSKTRVITYIEFYWQHQIKDDMILDPFLGSGTTATVAKKLGRKYYGIEKEKTYFKAAEDRD